MPYVVFDNLIPIRRTPWTTHSFVAALPMCIILFDGSYEDLGIG